MAADGRIVIDTELDDSGVDRGSEEMEKRLTALENALRGIGEKVGQSMSRAVSFDSVNTKIDSMVDQLQRLRTQAEQGFTSEGAVARFNDSLDILERKAERLRAKLEQLGQTKTPTDDYQFLQSEVDKTERKLESLLQRQERMQATGANVNTQGYKNLQYEIENARKALESMKAEMSSMEANGEAFKLGTDSAEYQQTASALQQVENELAQVRNVGAEAEAELAGFAGKHPILAALGAAAKKAGSAFLAMSKAIGTAALHTAQAAIKKLGSALRTVASGAKKAISGLLGFNKTAKKSVNPVNSLIRGLTSFKTMLISRIKRSFMSQVYQSLQEGIQQFARYNSEFNNAMSNIKNTGAQIGAQVASLVANIITVVEPVITRILSLINSVITAISALFAKITGKSTVAVAAKGTADYAAGLDDAAGSAGKAAKEQKKLNAELYGWDELNRQSKQDDSGGGGGATGPTWEEVSVDDILKDWEDIDWFKMGYDWAEKIANALDAIPWDTIQAAAYKVGQHLAELLNGIFANLHFANSLGTTIAEALNTGLSFALGFLETFDFSQFGVWAGTLWNAFVNAFDFDKLAQVISLGGNGIIDALTSFFQTIASTCETLGGGVAKIFNSIFVGIDFGAAANAILLGIHDINLALKGFNDSVDWDGAAQNIINGCNTLFRGMVLDENGKMTNVWAENGTQIGRLIGGFVHSVFEIVSGLDFKALGENIGNWFNNAFNEIDFTEALGIIVKGFNGLVNGLGSLLGTIDWSNVGKTLGESLLNAVKMIDWSGVGTTIGNLLIGALELLNGFIEGMDWGEFGASLFQGLINMLSSIDWVALIGNLFELLCGLVSGAVQLLLGAFAGLFDGFADAWEGIGDDSVSGFLRGLADNLRESMAWVKEQFQKVIDWVKGVFGIASPSTVFAEIGGFLIEGMLNGIKAAWESIKSFFSGALSFLKTTISGAWDNIKQNTSQAWDNIKTGLSTAWTNIKTTTSTAVQNVKTAVSTAWNNIKTNTTSAYNTIKSTVQSKFNEAKTAVTNAASTMKQNAVAAWQNMVSNASSKFASIYSTCRSKMNDAQNFLKGLNWSSIGTNLVNGLLNGLKSAWEGVTSWISSATSGLTEKVKDILGIASPSKVWAQIGVFLDEGLTQGLESGERNMLSTASGLAESLTDRMSNVDGSVALTSDGDIERLNIITSQLSGIAGIIDHIAQALASMGGLQIPQVAMGTVVPYRTKAAAMAGGGSYEMESTGYTDEMVQLLRNIRDYLAAGGGNNGGNKDIKVIIDGREVFNAVVNENNRALRRSGGVSPLKV